MTWIEIIELRTGENVKKLFRQTLQQPVSKADKKAGLEKMTMYHNLVLETDISMHLQWQTTEKEAGKTNLGMQITASFEDYGRVNHSIWVKD